MMDLVASLGWVRDNIEKFGGDPGRVMIFGQSGGGAKTSTMLAMPSAKGLFHRAGVQSGSTIRSATREQATRSAEAPVFRRWWTARCCRTIRSSLPRRRNPQACR